MSVTILDQLFFLDRSRPVQGGQVEKGICGAEGLEFGSTQYFFLFVDERSAQIKIYLCNRLSWVMINPKDMGWLMNMKLLLCNEYCLMLVLTYALTHKTAFALGIKSSYTESHVMALVATFASPGCCSSVPGPLKEGAGVQQLPGLCQQAAFGMWHGCNGRGLWPGVRAVLISQWMPPFREGPGLKGYLCYLHPSPNASHDLLCGAFHSGCRHRQQGWDARLCPCRQGAVSKDWKFVGALPFHVDPLADGEACSVPGCPMWQKL